MARRKTYVITVALKVKGHSADEVRAITKEIIESGSSLSKDGKFISFKLGDMSGAPVREARKDE